MRQHQVRTGATGPPRLRSRRTGELERLVLRQCEKAQLQIEEILQAMAAAKTTQSDSEVGEAPYASLRMMVKEEWPTIIMQCAALTSSPRIKNKSV